MLPFKLESPVLLCATLLPIFHSFYPDSMGWDYQESSLWQILRTRGQEPPALSHTQRHPKSVHLQYECSSGGSPIPLPQWPLLALLGRLQSPLWRPGEKRVDSPWRAAGHQTIIRPNCKWQLRLCFSEMVNRGQREVASRTPRGTGTFVLKTQAGLWEPGRGCQLVPCWVQKCFFNNY